MNKKNITLLTVSVIISLFLTVIFLAACRKDPALQMPNNSPQPGENCALALQRHTTPNPWPEYDYECPFCVNGCEFQEHARTYGYNYPHFNPSNPYQIVYNRWIKGNSVIKPFIFKMCTGDIDTLEIESSFTDWGTDGLIYFLNFDKQLCTIKPDGDSLQYRMTFNPSNIQPKKFLSPSNHFIESAGANTYQTKDISGNVYHTFTAPRAYRYNWIDDHTLVYSTASASMDSLFILDLRTSTHTLVSTFRKSRIDSSGFYKSDSSINNLCYNPNNHSIYWNNTFQILRYDLTSRTTHHVRKCYSSLEFKGMEYSATLRKFILEAYETHQVTTCDGTIDVSIYLMNEDGSDLRRINIPE